MGSAITGAVGAVSPRPGSAIGGGATTTGPAGVCTGGWTGGGGVPEGAVDVPELRLPHVQADVLTQEAGLLVQVVLADVPAAEGPEPLDVVAGRLVAVHRAGPRRGVDDEAAAHPHLEVQRRVDVAVVEGGARVGRTQLVGVVAVDLEARVAHAVVVRAWLEAMVVQRVAMLGGLERVVEDLTGPHATQRGREELVALVGLEGPELDIVAAQLELVAEEVGLVRVVVEPDEVVVGGLGVGHQLLNSSSVSMPLG
jgi:hypothetical protein